MYIDASDGIITNVIVLKSNNQATAEQRAKDKAQDDELIRQDWYVRVTMCDVQHAQTILDLQNGDF